LKQAGEKFWWKWVWHMKICVQWWYEISLRYAVIIWHVVHLYVKVNPQGHQLSFGLQVVKKIWLSRQYFMYVCKKGKY
jgi:hypothetical protein